MDYRIFLKTQFANLDLTEVLQQAPDVLLGVSPAAVAQLALLKAESVFDLANATVFNNAAQIVNGAADPNSTIGKHLAVPSEMIDNAAAGILLADLPAASLRNLVGVGNANGPAIEAALDVTSIRDLAFWPPFLAAKSLMAAAHDPFNAVDYDQQAPEELIPRTGQHTTQRVIFRKTILIESKPTTTLPWDGNSPLDLSQLDETGFSDVAFGAILTFNQRWTPKRVALGTLLHSLPLGPGESTNMAVVDWTRRLKAASREDINQTENLSSSVAQSTAISEITNAVATQVQRGESGAASISGSESASAVSFFGVGIGGGSESANATAATTYSVSNTTRSETASALQNISSHTHQNASLARSKRAAVVTEVSQEESESLTTRTVTNYNHMHALSIQYYEVVQIYETEVRTANIERCIFIPMLEVNFRSEANIKKYLNVLVRAALDKRTRDLLLQYRNTLVVEFNVNRLASTDLDQMIAAVNALPISPFDPSKLGGLLGLPPQIEKRIQLQLLQSQVNALRQTLALNSDAGFRRGIIEDFDRNRFQKLTVDRGAMLNNVSWDPTSGITAVRILLADGSQIAVTTPGTMSGTRTLNTAWTNPIPTSDVRGVEVDITEQDDNLPSNFKLFKLHLQLELGSRIFWLDASFAHSEGFSGTLSVFSVHTPVDIEELADLLMQHQLYYSQQVWTRADTQALIMQLAPYTIAIDGINLHIVDYIDPRPVTVAGNYVAFRFTYDADQPWKEWVAKQRRDERPRYDLIPVPTGGVFCEAVLGEFNAAEKLDASRFWNWKDSPIPFAAPGIAALTAGEHNRLGFPTPGDLPSDQLLKLGALPALPEGLTTSKEVLAALMAENLFKNMGGLDQTAKLFEAAQAAAVAGDKAVQDELLGTAKGLMTAFEQLTTSFLKSEGGVKNITELGSILNKLGGSGGASGSGLSSIMGLFGGGAGEAAGAAGGAAGGAGAAGAAEGVAGAVEVIGPLLAEIAPLIMLA